MSGVEELHEGFRKLLREVIADASATEKDAMEHAATWRGKAKVARDFRVAAEAMLAEYEPAPTGRNRGCIRPPSAEVAALIDPNFTVADFASALGRVAEQ